MSARPTNFWMYQQLEHSMAFGFGIMLMAVAALENWSAILRYWRRHYRPKPSPDLSSASIFIWRSPI